MIPAVIIDDEPNNVEALKALLQKYCPEVTISGTADTTETGYSLIIETKPNLVFLDIEIPYGNAFALLDRLSPINFEVIFVTAFDNYAISAIKYSALDYLLKPVNIKELQNAVYKAIERIDEKNTNQKIDNLLHNLKTTKTSQQKIALPSQNGFVFININEFVRLEASSNYTAIFLSNKKKFLVSRSLKDFEEILPVDFFSRVHHSHIVNHNFIKKYHQGRGGYLEMEDGTTIEVSSRKKESFLSKFSS